MLTGQNTKDIER